MKKIIVMILCLLFGCSFAACADKEGQQPAMMHNFSVNESEITLEVNDTFELVAAYGEEEITYSVENGEVATVSETGLVTAKKVGVTYVTISAGEEERTCKVNVVTYEYTVQIVGIAPNVNMTVNTVLQFSAKLYRNGVEYEGNVTWSANGGTVTSNGTRATFTVAQKGVYTVTATSEKGATASFVVTVGEALSDF